MEGANRWDWRRLAQRLRFSGSASDERAGEGDRRANPPFGDLIPRSHFEAWKTNPCAWELDTTPIGLWKGGR